jgi:hypothetical protein
MSGIVVLRVLLCLLLRHAKANHSFAGPRVCDFLGTSFIQKTPALSMADLSALLGSGAPLAAAASFMIGAPLRADRGGAGR